MSGADDRSEARTPVIVCVDDFGLTPGINCAVAHLCDLGVISATACMPLGPAWAAGLALLTAERRGRLDVGLHFNLTEPTACQHSRTLPRLIGSAYLRQMPPMTLQTELQRQLDAFEDSLGSAPDFVDGHQHVHQLPQVREVLINELCRRYAQKQRPYVRCTVAPRDAGLPERAKARVIETLGAKALREMLTSAGIEHNARLLGVYGFAPIPRRFETYLDRWAQLAQPWDLLMVHPSIAIPSSEGPRVSDGIAAARLLEFEVLSHSSQALYAHHALQPAQLSKRNTAPG